MTMNTTEKLPAEINLQILSQLPDFYALENLLEASPQAVEVFPTDYLQITQAVQASCQGKALDLTRLFHLVALVRAPSAKYSSLDDLLETFHGQRFDQACTTELLAQWDVLPHRREQGLAHPSWVEEFRVYQALWCLQLISDLYHATGPDPAKSQSGESWGGWGWSEAEIQNIKTYRSYLPDAFEVGSLLRASWDEIQCVSDSLRELGALCHSPVDEPVPEAHATNSTDKFDYVAPFFESLQTPNMPNGSVWSMQPFPQNSEINTKWHRSARHASRGFISSFYRKEVFLRERTKNHGPPTPGLEKIREFPKLGLFIWDLWRMYCMGLMKPGKPGTPAPDGSVAEALSTCEIFEELSRWCKLIS